MAKVTGWEATGVLTVQRAAQRIWEAVAADGHNASIRLAKRLHEGSHSDADSDSGGSNQPFCVECLWRARVCLAELSEMGREANR